MKKTELIKKWGIIGGNIKLDMTKEFEKNLDEFLAEQVGINTEHVPASYIVSETDILQKKTYYHIKELLRTNGFIKYKFVDSDFIQILPIEIFREKYIIEEILG